MLLGRSAASQRRRCCVELCALGVRWRSKRARLVVTHPAIPRPKGPTRKRSRKPGELPILILAPKAARRLCRTTHDARHETMGGWGVDNSPPPMARKGGPPVSLTLRLFASSPGLAICGDGQFTPIKTPPSLIQLQPSAGQHPGSTRCPGPIGLPQRAAHFRGCISCPVWFVGCRRWRGSPWAGRRLPAFWMLASAKTPRRDATWEIAA